MSWLPHNGAQEEFLQRTEFEVLFGGAAGPGKTDCLIAAMTRDIEHPKYHGLIVRRTFPQLREIIDRCHLRYPGLGGVYKATDKRWLFPSGAKIDLGHMQHEDDKYNYHGAEFQKIAIDESTKFSETQYLYLFSRVRTTDPDINCQILSATNPGGIGHQFVRDRFRPGERDGKTFYDPRTGLSRVFIPATIEDNPTLFENDPVYVARLESLPELERKRQLFGIWDAFEGQIFTELSQSVHGYEDFPIPPEWERYCVFDWGFAKPFSVGWYAVDYDGIIHRYREWYGSKHADDSSGYNQGLRMQAWEVARGILEREREAGEKIKHRIADPSIWGLRPEFRKKEARGPKINDDFVQEGVYFTKGDNDRIAGKQQVHKRLKPEIEVDEETGEIISQRAMLMVANSCKHFWRTFPLLHEDTKNPDDVDTKQEDHCLHGDTLVATDSGDIQIRKLVGTTGRVLTVNRQWTNFWDCRKTRKDAELVALTFSDGRRIVCTPDHKILSHGDSWFQADVFLDKLVHNFASAAEETVRCIKVEPAGRADVYCLVADETHSFAVEGGLIVANCYDEVRYMCMSRPLKPEKVVTIPAGSFQAERARYIRAKKYAKRHGLSMPEAYRKVR